MDNGVSQADPSPGVSNQSASADGYTTTEAITIRLFVLDAGVLGYNDSVTTITEMRGFARGSMR